MSYQERGSGPPHFDGKNYQMWSKRMAAFLRGKGQILWDVTVDKSYVQPMNFLALGSRDMFDANNKVVDYLFRALCQPEFDRVHTESLACRIWSVLKEAHVGNAQVQARMYATYRREYENFTHLPGDSIDALFQRFTVVVNNMRANVDVLLYDDHDRAFKLLHSLGHTIWGGKFEAIVESEKYDTLTVNELFSKLKSAEVDCGMTAKIEGPTDSHSLAFIGGSKGKANTNPSTKMFSLSSLMSMLDEEFDVLGEDELALLARRFERLHENRVNMRRNTRTCFKCGKAGHYFAECVKVNNNDKHKFKDKRKKSKKKDPGHGKKTRSPDKMKRSSDIESDSEDTSSSLSDEDEEDDKKKKKNLSKYLNGLCVTGLSLKDDFCGMARSSSSKRSQKDASDLDSEDEVCDELSSLRKENEELVDLLDNCDHMLREAKKLMKELRALLEYARTRVTELETQVLDGKLEIDSLKASPVSSDEDDCADCSVFLADLTALREKHASKCEELDVLRVELAELQSRPTLLGACTSCPGLHEKIVELHSRIVSLEADLKVPIPTSCSTCELHAMKNMELATMC
jgi:hypothetical protein